MFLFVTMKSSIIVLSSTFSSNDALRSEGVIEIAGENSCSVKGSCCCGVNAHKTNDCCCNSPILSENSGQLVAGTSNSKYFAAMISSMKCSHVPGDYQIGSLSDYGLPSLNLFLCLLEDSGFNAYFQEDHIVEPRPFLPYKPPKNIL